MEIERKYLLSALPPREILGRGVAIRQGYIDAADPEIRVRQKGSEFFLTVKSGAGVRREECEVQIPAATFEKLWSLTEGARVVKTRYTVPHGDARWEIDEFGGALAGLYLAEVELASESATRDTPRVPGDRAGRDRRPTIQEQEPGHAGTPALLKAPERYRRAGPYVTSGNRIRASEE